MNTKQINNFNNIKNSILAIGFFKILFIILLILAVLITTKIFNPFLFKNNIVHNFYLTSLWIFVIFIFFVNLFFYLYENKFWSGIRHLIYFEDQKFFTWKKVYFSFFLPILDIYRLLFLFSLFEENGIIISNWKVGTKKNQIKFTIYDISLAAVLLSIFFIMTAIKNYTPLRIIGLDFEFIFYIIFAIFFGKFKGAFLSFIADFFSLLLAGRIGFYHEVYAIVPVIMTILIGLFLDLFKKNKKLSIIVMEIFLILAFAALIYTFVLNMNDPKGIKISKTFGLSRLGVGVFSGLLSLTLSLFVIFNVVVIVYFSVSSEAKKQKYLYLLLSIFLVFFVIVVARWVWGPIAFIQYANRYLGKGYLLSDRYLIIMVPIILRSVIAIPIYILIVNSLMPILILLKKNIVKDEYNLTY
nr:ECF transporter S component [Mycoplasmopsis canis]WQQ12529.1 ECF transporter S component [Mycoplasmopsis canis]